MSSKKIALIFLSLCLCSCSSGKGGSVNQNQVIKAEVVDYRADYEGKEDEYLYSDTYSQREIAHREAVNKSIEKQSELDNYYHKLINSFFKDNEKNELFSPLNIYFALNLLAQCSDSETKREIENLIGSFDFKTLWEANNYDSPLLSQQLANSLWLNQEGSYKNDFLKDLASNYYASSYIGEMGSAEFNKDLQNWLNENTGGLLEDNIASVSLDSSTLLALATTIYYKAAWVNEFNPSYNTNETFYGSSGEVQKEMLHLEKKQSYYQDQDYQAVSLSLQDNTKLWLILPNEGIELNTLVANNDLTILRHNAIYEKTSYPMVKLSMPKLDITASYELSSTLKELGIQKAFSDSADFSPISEMSLTLSSIRHDARLLADEEGVSAAAFTVSLLTTTALEPISEIIEFNLNRPFIFMLCGADDSILFIGSCNN